MTTNKNKLGAIETKNIRLGECVFPFKYYQDPVKRTGDKVEWNECIDGPKGKWCATEVTSSGGVKKMGYCIDESGKVKLGLKIKPKVDLSKFDKYRSPNILKVTPDIWELPNRKTYPLWVDQVYDKYSTISKKKKCSDPVVCPGKFDLFPHQKFVRDYFQPVSPYRGILLYHGLGVGKTCASIAIAEGFKSNREIVVILNKSLKQNFIINLQKCGDEYVRLRQYWEFHKVAKGDSLIKLGVEMGIPQSVILKNAGIWLIDFSKKDNYESLSKFQISSLNDQINAMINKRYSFIHLNGLTSKKLQKMREKRILDNKILIIDEVHNLTNGMAKGGSGVRARFLENMIMTSKNLKLVFLSGTPMINNLFEIGKTFNLLRGYIYSYSFILKPIGGNQASFPELEKLLDANVSVDQYFAKPVTKNIVIVKTPDNFIHTSIADKQGYVYTPTSGELSDPDFLETEFLKNIQELFKSNGYTSTYSIQKHTAVPNDEDEFMRLFFNDQTSTIKNAELFKSRVLGLVSHYASSDTTKMPTVNKVEIVNVEMSDYQFLKYMTVRKKEIEQDKSKKKSGNEKPKAKTKAESPGSKGDGGQEELFKGKSSYRAYSRMHCSFVFPENIPRPTPSDDFFEDSIEGDVEGDLLEDVEDVEVDKATRIKAYEEAKNRTLTMLDDQRSEFLVVNDDEKLLKYSPKYNTIVDKILKSPGNVFVYTEYRTLEGISVFSIVMKANGYAPFLLGKDLDGNWQQIYENPEDVDKPKYAFWGADEEISDLLLKIFNNEIDKIPPSLRKQLFSDGVNNIRGDIIKLLMTTKKGAEGISLQNVRQVHIIEPYWNPVRLEQVQGRAVRVGSHLQLPPKDRNVDVYIYLSVIKEEHRKSDKTIQDDSGGKSSDEILFDISDKKLNVMKSLLKLVKEVSIDCGLNIKETQDPKDPHTCVNYSTKSRKDFTYIPNIREDVHDEDIRRRYVMKSWTPKFIQFKKGDPESIYAIRDMDGDGNDLLYDYEQTKSGRPGDPVGEMKTVPGRARPVPVFYRKGGKLSRKNT